MRRYNHDGWPDLPHNVKNLYSPSVRLHRPCGHSQRRTLKISFPLDNTIACFSGKMIIKIGKNDRMRADINCSTSSASFVAKGEALHKREGRGTCTPHRYPRVPSNHHTFNNEAPSQVISPPTSQHTTENKKHPEQSAKHKSVLQMPRQHERWQRRRKHRPAHRRRKCLAQGSDICDERGQ